MVPSSDILVTAGGECGDGDNDMVPCDDFSVTKNEVTSW